MQTKPSTGKTGNGFYNQEGSVYCAVRTGYLNVIQVNLDAEKAKHRQDRQWIL
jgi:hypothetical protein